VRSLFIERSSHSRLGRNSHYIQYTKRLSIINTSKSIHTATMKFFAIIFAMLVATLTSAQQHGMPTWSSSQAATTTVAGAQTIQSYCPGQTQPAGRYTYNSSNPFPISTYATVHSTVSASPSYPAGNGTAIAPTGTAASSGFATHSPSASPTIMPYTGGASSLNFGVVGALGGFGVFAVAAALF